MQDLEFRQLVERLKLRVPIEEIVSQRVADLRKKGSLYQARCPFHEERTPSFTVDPRRGTWRCWGACGEGGDVLRFLEKFDGVSFLDALRLLAQHAGEDLPDALFQKRARREDPREAQSYEVLTRAEALYRRSFQGDGGAAARDYMARRGLSPEILERFGVGWAPRDGNPLLKAATQAGVAAELLLSTGLIGRTEEGRRYDFFRGRVTVPIRDRMGRTVGFGARVLPEDEQRADGRPQAKYVNTPETDLFHKGRLIYALDLALAAVRRSRHLVLVEGYTDVMAAHQVGHENVAAVLGTSTTEDHAALIKRTGARRVTLVFDGDDAGRNASLRALRGLLPLGLELVVATLPKGVDPADLLLGEDGAQRFEDLLTGARDWFAWALEDLAPLRGPALAAGVDELFGLFAELANAVERSSRLEELAQGLGLPAADLRTQWAAFEQSRRRGPRARRSRPEEEEPPVEAAAHEVHVAPVDPATERAFEYLLGALLLDNSLIPVYADLLDKCPEGELHTLFQCILTMYDDVDDEEPIHGGRLLTLLGDAPARHRAARLEDLAGTAESPQVLARDQERWLEKRRHESELRALRDELDRSNKELGGAATEERSLLTTLHQELKRRRVPDAAPGSSNP